MPISKRAQSIAESGTFVVKKMAMDLAAQGHDVIDLGPGEPDFDTVPEAMEAGAQALQRGLTRYTPAAGMQELRETIASHYRERFGAKIGPKNVFIGVGGKGALYHVFLTLLNPGDEVVVPSPYWVSYPEQIALAEGRSVHVSTEDSGFVLEARHIESALTPRSVAAVVNSPSNPTGRIIPAEGLHAILEAARRRNFTVVADECYEAYDYEGKFASVMRWWNDCPDRLILTHTFSKAYAMTGWRVGYAVAPEDFVAAMGRLQSHTASGTSTMAQFAAAAAMRARGASLGERLHPYRARRNYVASELQNMPGLELKAVPEGSFYLFPSVKGAMKAMGCATSTDFARHLLNKAHVAVVPGVEFGADGYVRVSYAVSDERLREAMARLRKFLSAA